MSVLGQPYRIMYLSRGVSGLTNVGAMIYRPDKTFAGVFPLVELPAPLRTSYSFDYLSSTEDREGEYFCIVTSPSEAVNDITRFSLYKQTSGNAQSVQTVDIVATITNDSVDAFVFEQDLVTAKVADSVQLQALMMPDRTIINATIFDANVRVEILADETLSYSRDISDGLRS